ncbi:hypothetical protein KY019_002909 [Vibrio cholerae]|nr:hypothetical protein [Vibrio cholerae]EJL6669474.1 hypothetical protein [Vibrio cholerae]
MGRCNIIDGGYYNPHVYFIFAKEVIYIGETQMIPIKRWSSHLSSNGSFSKKLNRHLDGECVSSYMTDIRFCSYSCYTELSSIEKYYCGYRIPTQALEHKLHEIVISDKTFGTEKKILSETLKTAPRRFYHWDEITELAKLIVKEVKLNLNLKGQA